MSERKHLRLKNWDYSNNGIYYITICCHNKQKSFGEICDGRITHSEIGQISSTFWQEIPQHFSHVKLDEFVVMPNHVHGILILDYSMSGTQHDTALHSQFSRPIKNSVSVIVNQFKSSVTRWCNKEGYYNFKWQSRFYDTLLKNETALDNIREYIHNNPKNELYQ